MAMGELLVTVAEIVEELWKARRKTLHWVWLV